MRAFLSLFAVSARLTLRTIPDLGSVTIAVVRLAAVPVTTGLFYLALATGGGAVSPSTGDALAAGAAVGALSASMAASSLVTLDKFEVTMPHLLLSTAGRPAAWAGRLSTLVGLGLITAIGVSIVGFLIAAPRWSPSEWSLVPAVLVVAAYGGVGIGTLLGALGLGMRDSLVFANFAEFSLPLLCGVVAPVSILPIPLQWAAAPIPITYAISAGRVLGSESGDAVVLELAISFLIGTFWLIAGLVAWRVVETRARSTGSFDLTPL
jgi:ABC-2 type transport system permease protein